MWPKDWNETITFVPDLASNKGRRD
jgi:hypothetical protein